MLLLSMWILLFFKTYFLNFTYFSGLPSFFFIWQMSLLLLLSLLLLFFGPLQILYTFTLTYNICPDRGCAVSSFLPFCSHVTFHIALPSSVRYTRCKKCKIIYIVFFSFSKNKCLFVSFLSS